MVTSLLRRLFATQPEPIPADEIPLAMAVLMVRIARADGEYADSEIRQIDEVLVKMYGETDMGATILRAEAEKLEAEAPDTVRFTRALKAGVALEDRIALVEALWSVVLVDGGRDAQEDRILRMVVSLLGVTDIQSGLARRRVLERGALGISKSAKY